MTEISKFGPTQIDKLAGVTIGAFIGLVVVAVTRVPQGFNPAFAAVFAGALAGWLLVITFGWAGGTSRLFRALVMAALFVWGCLCAYVVVQSCVVWLSRDVVKCKRTLS